MDLGQLKRGDLNCAKDLGAAEKGHPDCAKEVRVSSCKERHLACVMNLRGQPKRVTWPVPRLLGERAKTKTKTKTKTGLRVI